MFLSLGFASQAGEKVAAVLVQVLFSNFFIILLRIKIEVNLLRAREHSRKFECSNLIPLPFPSPTRQPPNAKLSFNSCAPTPGAIHPTG
jgi:hypothetical protein